MTVFDVGDAPYLSGATGLPLPPAHASSRADLSEALLSAQNQALKMVIHSAPLPDVLGYLTSVVESLAGHSVTAAILLLDAEGRLRTGAAKSLPDEYNAAIDGLKASADLGTCSVAAAIGKVVITPDIAADPKWASIAHLPLSLGLRAAWSQPITASDGRVLGTFGTYFRERREPSSLERRLVATLAHTAALAIERRGAEEGMERQRRIYDMALEAAAMAPWRLSFATGVCEFSPRAQELYGLREGTLTLDESAVRRLFHPDDVPAIWLSMHSLRQAGGADRFRREIRVRRPEGGWRWISVWGVTEHAGDGCAPAGIVGASCDITDRKEAEHNQKILVDELRHRVKNTLAVVDSIAAQTLRTTPDPAAFQTAFSARLAALSRAHSLLSEDMWRGASMRGIIGATLSVFGAEHMDGRIRVEGPPVRLPANGAVTLSLVFHELVTNAMKYGALSTPSGEVEIRWTIGDGPGDNRVSLGWREYGGPPVSPPKRRGLGSRLIESSAAQLGGEAALEFRPDGVACRMDFVARKAGDDPALA